MKKVRKKQQQQKRLEWPVIEGGHTQKRILFWKSRKESVLYKKEDGKTCFVCLTTWRSLTLT